MDLFEIGENCRICLCDLVAVDWNEEIFELCGMTYKDCYFKYTQLEESDPDPFSPMLCKKCSEDLKNSHFLIETALESFRVLQHAYNTDTLIDEELKYELSPSICTTTKQEEFEVCLIRQSNESLIDIENNNVINFEDTEADCTEYIETFLDNIPQSSNNQDWTSTQEDIADNSELIEYQNEHEVKEFKEILNNERSLQFKPMVPKQEENKECVEINSEISLRPRTSRRKIKELEDDPDKKENISQSLSPPPGEPKKKRKKKEPLMCAICSQILVDIYSLKKHEAIHDKNRERKEVCPQCGLRFYSKMSLRSHMLTHKKNREKPYKCEFCEKAYFNRGALNVHRRMHLGLTIKCTFCPKEFCRQIDLDCHLKTHSSTPLHLKYKQTKFLVHCKDCNSQIPSRRWRAHQAAHRNEPQVKCTICNRDFYSRKNCTKHINKMHNKTREEYDTYMHFYVEKSEMRMSHLMLQQTAEIIKQ